VVSLQLFTQHQAACEMPHFVRPGPRTNNYVSMCLDGLLHDPTLHSVGASVCNSIQADPPPRPPVSPVKYDVVCLTMCSSPVLMAMAVLLCRLLEAK
jgi:hypothetical protein